MITIVANFTRPSLDVPFYSVPSELKDEFMTKYRYTGKSLSNSSTISADRLSSQTVTVWHRRLDFTEYSEDPLSDAMRTLRAAYCEEHGITFDVEVTFIPSQDDPGAEPPAAGTPVNS